VIIVTRIKFHTIFYASTSLLDKEKKRLVIIKAENFKNYMVLQDSVFPFGHEGLIKVDCIC